MVVVHELTKALMPLWTRVILQLVMGTKLPVAEGGHYLGAWLNLFKLRRTLLVSWGRIYHFSRA
jgi:hypothetical protein